jgi:predicted nucleotidyltransferase
MLRETFDHLVRETLAACQAHYGDRLVSLAVFGSVARQTQRPDSDIDLLLVADGLPDGRVPRVREFDAVEQRVGQELAKAAEVGVHTRLSPIFKTPAELDIGSPLLLDMVDDARILFDRDATLQRRLERLRDRLVELKARRIRKAGGYYWQLKPDFKPGDEIRL